MDNNSVILCNWKGCAINDVSIKIHYGYTATANENDGGSKYLRITDIQDNKVNWDTVPFCEIDDKDIEKFELKENDIVFARTGGTVGKSFLIKNDVPFKAVFASYLIRIKLSNYIDQKFIYLFFQSLNYWSQIELGKTGLKTNVNAQILSKLKLNLAPLPEQHAIVSKIEQLFSDLDNGIENFKKAQEQLKRYRQSVLKAACEGRLVPTEAELARSEGRDYEPADVLLARILKERREKWNGKGKYKEPAALDTNDLWELPEGWGWATLEQYAFEVKDGTHDSPKYQESGIPFVTQKNIKKNGFDFSNTNKITNEDHNKFYRRSNPESGDVLISMIGANRGMSCIVNVETVFSIKNVGLVKSYKQFNIFKFIDYYMKSQVGQRLILDKSKGGAQEFIGLTELRSWPISVPPLTEQRRIVFEVERRLSLCDKMETTIAESLQKAESLRQSILKKAFEGKLLNEKELEEARNAPDWEPAEKLLERICQEKQIKENNNKPTRRKTHG